MTNPDSTAHARSTADQPLLDALRQGDQAAFAALVEKYQSSMVRVAQFYVRDRAVAEEVVQETWLRMLNGLDRFEGRSSLKTWLFRILVNWAQTRGKREGRSLPFSALQPPGEAPDEPAEAADRFFPPDHPHLPGHWASTVRRWDEQPEAAAQSRETLEIVRRAIEALPPGQRAVITLRDVDGWSAAEACNALQISETNQRVLLHRARTQVRRALEAYYDSARDGA